MCEYVYMTMCGGGRQEVREQLCGVSYLFPLFHGFQDWTQATRLAQQTPLPAEPSCQSVTILVSLCFQQYGSLTSSLVCKSSRSHLKQTGGCAGLNANAVPFFLLSFFLFCFVWGRIFLYSPNFPVACQSLCSSGRPPCRKSLVHPAPSVVPSKFTAFVQRLPHAMKRSWESGARSECMYTLVCLRPVLASTAASFARTVWSLEVFPVPGQLSRATVQERAWALNSAEGCYP